MPAGIRKDADPVRRGSESGPLICCGLSKEVNDTGLKADGGPSKRRSLWE